jgi:plasmid maintenance system antidote protein VapI
MKKNDKNQNEISYMVDISPEHASRVMSGKYKPSLELAVKFKKACSIPPEAWLDELEA